MWKILERKVPNFSPPIQCHISDRRGRLCSSGVVPTGHLGTLCHNSFRNRAATLFNCLPKHIRNIVNCANPIMFKRALENHLCSIEDSPMVPNECNSLNSRSDKKTMTDMWKATIADQLSVMSAATLQILRMTPKYSQQLTILLTAITSNLI